MGYRRKMMFKLTDCGVIRLSDNAYIPDNKDNSDWQRYLEWVNAGNTPQEQYSLEERRQIIVDKVKNIRLRKETNPIQFSGSEIKIDDSLCFIMKAAIDRSITLEYLDINNIEHTGIKENLIDIVKVYFDKKFKLLKKYNNLVSAVQKSENPESINIDIGW